MELTVKKAYKILKSAKLNKLQRDAIEWVFDELNNQLFKAEVINIEQGFVEKDLDNGLSNDKITRRAIALQHTKLLKSAFVYPIDDFIEVIDAELYTDDDGCADALDKNCNLIEGVNCDIVKLEYLKKNGCEYILWRYYI